MSNGFFFFIQQTIFLNLALGCEQYQLVLEVKPQEALHFGHELPPPASYQVQVSARDETNMTMSSSSTRTNSTKYEGKFILTISNFAETLATFALKGGHSRNDVFFEVANRKITLI